MRAALLACCFTLLALPAQANARLTVLLDVLGMAEAVEILREEGFAYAATLDTDMLGGEGGALWQAQVGQIYDTDRISERLRQAMEEGLAPEEIEAITAFFATDTGQRIVSLENAARRAMADPQIEEAAREIFDARAVEGDPLVGLVSEFIAVNDLVERNVSGVMSSNYQFFKAMNDGGLTDETETQILAEVWAQEPAIREDTTGWLNAFLLMAYQPLSAQEMQGYVSFSASDAGQALNAALFDGFNAVYRDISYALGRAIALHATSDEI